MKKISDLCYAKNSEAQKLDIYLPNGKASCVFVYFHGGGIEKGDKSSAEIFAPYLTDRGIAVISANYRMYPDASFPDFIYDSAMAVAFSNDYMKNELDCNELFVGGSSAGGYLTMMLCFDPKYLASVGLDNSAIAGYLHDAGQPTAHFNVLKYAGVDPRRIIVDETAPLYFMGTADSYPYMRFIVSDNDMKNRYEQTMLVLSTLSHFGYTNFDHVVMHGKHCAYVKQFDDEGVCVFAKLVEDFIKSKK